MSSATAPAGQLLHVDPAVLDQVSDGLFYDPHRILGAHLNPAPPLDGRAGLGTGTATVRALRPLARQVTVITPAGSFPAGHEHNGVFAAVVPAELHNGTWSVPDYRIRVLYPDGSVHIQDDPYRHLPTLGDVDIYLIGEGRHERLWEALGAHVRHMADPMGREDGTLRRRPDGEVHGTAFAVWAPNARAVRVVGDFNAWDGRIHAMRALGTSGVWELFIPGVHAGAAYKYQILGPDGRWRVKADPMERAHEVPPHTASIVADSRYRWGDDAWMRARRKTNPHTRPISIYEVHAASWKHGLDYRGLADQLVPYVKSQGFTHVEFMPLEQHPFDGSWGYQVTGYYAPDARLGSPDDFRTLVDAFHRAGIGVVMDWVPAHFPKDDFALGRFDGTPLYEDPDPTRGEHPEWGTYVFNFGRREVRNFLVANACYWLEVFHIDALRVDAVSSMLYLDYSRGPGQWHPNIHGGHENLEAISLLQEITATAYRTNPGTMMIAEESTAWHGVTAPTSAGGLGFGFKWNMGWMHDTLRYLQQDPLNRRYHHNEITFSMVYAYSEHFILPLSHDEVVYGKGSLIGRMPGDDWRRFAGVRALFAYQWAHPGRKLIFMGDDIAQFGEWDYRGSVDWKALDWPDHRGVQRLVADLNSLYRRSPALWSLDFEPEGFQWLTSDDADHNTLSFLRIGSHDERMAVVVNFSGLAWHDYRVPLPCGGCWREVLSTDDRRYGGSGVRNGSAPQHALDARPEPYHARGWSVRLTVPALGALFLELEP